MDRDKLGADGGCKPLALRGTLGSIPRRSIHTVDAEWLALAF
jgi:hypothetical protein